MATAAVVASRDFFTLLSPFCWLTFARRHDARASSLPKGPRDLLPKWLEQVLERGALVGLNESLNRHAWNKANVVQARDLGRRQRNADGIVGLGRLERVLLLLVSRDIGGHAREPAGDHRRSALVAREDAHDRLGPDGDLVDVGGSDLGFHHQLVGARHDLHDGLAVADYAP